MFATVISGKASARYALACMITTLGVVAGGMATPRDAQARASSSARVLAPCIPAGHDATAIPSIAFGRKGGNMRPLTVKIYGDGTVTYAGATPVSTGYAVKPDAVLGLWRLADAEGFATWPTVFKGSTMTSDSASLFVTIRAGCSTTTKTVTMRPGANQPGFWELYDTLTAAAGLSSR
jgi:hypothetical protein